MYKCIKETYFKQRLFKPGQTYSGADAPEEYFVKLEAVANVNQEKPPKRMRADGKSIKADSVDTLPGGGVKK